MKHSASYLKLIILQIDQHLAVLRRRISANRNAILRDTIADDLAAQIDGIKDLYEEILMFTDAPSRNSD